MPVVNCPIGDCPYATPDVDAVVAAALIKVIQLLECCDEQLRKDLTRTAGGTLTGKTEEAGCQRRKHDGGPSIPTQHAPGP